MLFLNQISSQMLGEISFSIKVSRCWVRSVPLVRNMPFKEDTCFLPDCPKRLSFSLELLQDVPSSSWDLECAVTLCHDLVKVCFTQTCSVIHFHLIYKLIFYSSLQICLNEMQVKRNVQVIRSHIPNPSEFSTLLQTCCLSIINSVFMCTYLL